MQDSKSSNAHGMAAPLGAASTPAAAGRGGIVGAYIRLMDAVSNITAVAAGILLVAGVLVVCQMIFVRYLLGESTIWQTEFTIYSITGAMLLGSPYVLMTGGHVAVTVLVDSLQGPVRKAMNLIASLVGLSFCTALAYASWHYVAEAYIDEWTTGTAWNAPLWPAIAPMAVGATLLALQYVAEILRGD